MVTRATCCWPYSTQKKCSVVLTSALTALGPRTCQPASRLALAGSEESEFRWVIAKMPKEARSLAGS